MVGVSGRFGQLIDQLAPLCVALAPSGRWANQVPVEPPNSRTGGDGGEPADFACPSGTILLGTWALAVEVKAVNNQVVSEINLECGTQEPAAGYTVRASRHDDSGELYIPYETEMHCPSGHAVTGLNVRSGDYIDSIATVCSPMSVLSPPPKPIVKLTPRVKPSMEVGETVGKDRVLDFTNMGSKPSAPTSTVAIAPASLYAFRSGQGQVQLYQYSGGSAGTWQPAHRLGMDFTGVARLIPGGSDGVYAQMPDGTLYFISRSDLDGSGNAQPIRLRINTRAYALFAGADDGVLYGVTADGDVDWFRNVALASGGNVWQGPVRVATGWTDLKQIFSGGGGIVYAMKNDGHVLWRRHDGALTGSGAWTGGVQVGNGWADFANVFTPGGGFIYALTPTGELMIYRHRGFKNGVKDWDAPIQVASGWPRYTSIVALP